MCERKRCQAPFPGQQRLFCEPFRGKRCLTPFSRRPARRRGVLLLVVLSVLILFLLLTVTYVIVASKARVTGKITARIDQSGDPPYYTIDQVAMTLFRGTADPHCPFATWSLLEGAYGNIAFRGGVGGPISQPAGGQFLSFTPTGPFVWYNTANSATPVQFNTSVNFYKGCVLTMLNGPCVGLSTRIVASSNGSLTVMRFKADVALLDPAPGDTFLINGRAYSGMGRGYNPTATAGSPALNAVDPNNWLYALLPNTTSFQANTTTTPNYTDPAGPGGDNPDYTAYDYQSYYLGLVTHAAQGSGIPPVLPSFHHPEVWNYWATQNGGNPPVALQRKILFRPNAIDHPLFTTSTNPTFNPGNPMGPYDVDNLGTGTPDSIWIDPGLPVMVGKDGRTYKILVAPLILDFDGRLNVNAHGSYAQLDPNYPSATGGNAALASTQCQALASGAGAAQLPIGQGYGPAEVNLLAMFSNAEVQNLLAGNSGTGNNYLQGRYGQYQSPIAGRALSGWRFFEYPPNDWRGAPMTSFGTPPDVWGHRLLALDVRGQPLYLTPGSNPTQGTSSIIPLNSNQNYWIYEVFDSNGKLDNPYGFDLSQQAIRPGRQMPTGSGGFAYASGPFGYNNPFTVGELERLLRMYDIDSRSLPPRLYALLSSMQVGSAKLQADPWRNQSITTDSFDPPSPSVLAPTAFRSQLAGNGYRAFGITDLVRAKLQSTGVAANGMDAEIANLLAPELIAGIRMDINQPFGNGRDDNNNNLVDEASVGQQGGPANSAAPDSATESVNTGNTWPSGYSSSGSVPLNCANGLSTIDPLLKNNNLSQGCKTRQLMARHLYTLMMLFSDTGFVNWTSGNETPALNNTQLQQLTSRRIAQWAINAVCFRDSTSIMTPFVYHADIFQSSYAGWTNSGDPGDPANQPPAGQLLTANNIGVVWGCKPPDLVLTETLAFHDRRVADTKWDNGNQKQIYDQASNGKMNDKGGDAGTPNCDQTRVPQGSAFFELYCPRNPNNPIAPGDLYTLVGGQWYLNLSKMTPNDSQGNAWPVWRMAIGQSTHSTGNPNYSVLKQLQNHQDTTTFEPGYMNILGPQQDAPNIPIERVVWLGQTPPPAGQRTNVYYNQNTQNPTYVQPDGYAVIGPRASTAVGSDNSTGAAPWGTETNSQRITISPAANFGVKGASGAQNYPNNADIKQPVGVICQADFPSAWNGGKHPPGTGGVGLNVTEPLPGAAYYPEPLYQNTANGFYEAYGDLTETNPNYFLDQPLESSTTGASWPGAASCPIVGDGMIKTGTYTDYKTVFLQRLADPTSPYDQYRNPYITVDWMPIDVTVFNGEEAPSSMTHDPAQPAQDPDDPGGANAKVQFAARQRGGSDPNNLPNPQTYNIWAPVATGDSLPQAAAAYGGAGAGPVFTAQLTHSLGFLNLAYGPGFTSAGAAGLAPQYIGDPQHPFPWITWNARPYASLMELLMVPASMPERLAYELSGPGVATPTINTAYQIDPYKVSAVPMPQNADARGPFAHLLNFFCTTDNSFQPAPSPTAGSNFYRALEYMQVPSRFVGTETILNPSVFSANGNGGTATQFFLPPYNYVSNYRDPGRINLNTMTSQEVAAALFSGLPSSIIGQWFDSRRGDGNSSGQLINPSTTLPTYFASPYRSAAGADCVPIPGAVPGGMINRGVDVTLLRSHPPATGTKPLFGNDPTGAPQDYNNSPRNAYFAYQNLERISNMVTTRSNVFGVWLTIGYFEATPWTGNPPGSGPNVDPGHPDGYQLGPELGAATGDIERHRAFYIFDRSIPVGFERGQNHNVNRAVLLKRYIE